MNLKNGLLAGGFVLMAVIAAVGWSKAERNGSAATPANYSQSAEPTPAQAASTQTPADQTAAGQTSAAPAYGQPADYNATPSASNASASSAYGSSSGTYGVNGTAGNQTYSANASYASYGTPQYGSPQGPCVDPGTGVAYGNGQYYPDARYVQSIHRPVVVREYVGTQPATYSTREVREDVYYRHHHRSGKKSVAIVAGSAGVGAAIGAIAGGGKGAGIGALAGGAGGFIYDRLTHNR